MLFYETGLKFIAWLRCSKFAVLRPLQLGLNSATPFRPKGFHFIIKRRHYVLAYFRSRKQTIKNQRNEINKFSFNHAPVQMVCVTDKFRYATKIMHLMLSTIIHVFTALVTSAWYLCFRINDINVKRVRCKHKVNESGQVHHLFFCSSDGIDEFPRES